MAVSEQPAAETAAESVNNEAVEETPAQVDNRASQEVPDDGIAQVDDPSPKEEAPSEDVVVSVDDESKSRLFELFKKIGMVMQTCIITLLKFLLGKVHIKFIPQFSFLDLYLLVGQPLHLCRSVGQAVEGYQEPAQQGQAFLQCHDRCSAEPPYQENTRLEGI